MHRVLRTLAPLGAMAALLAVAAPASAAPPDGKVAKVCTTCHKTAEPGTIRGHFDELAMKSKSFQMKVDGDVEVLTFDPASLKVVNATETGDMEKVLKGIKKGAESRVEYVVDGAVKRVTLLSLKPKLKVPEAKQVKTAELEKLVAMGPEKGKYFLFDARPAPKYAEGYIPTAESLPFPAFEKKLPALMSTLRTRGMCISRSCRSLASASTPL